MKIAEVLITNQFGYFIGEIFSIFDFDFITGKISKNMGLTNIGKVLPEGPERIELINQFLHKHLF